jgi:pyroglutamyl-peptidase
MAPPVRVAFTGFGAFPGVPDNPSARLIEALRASPDPAFAGCSFDVLEVAYAAVGPALGRILARNPRALVMTGYSRQASALQLECAATDLREPARADAAGFAPSERASAITSLACPNVDFAALREALAVAGIAAELSHDAGSYVCNHLLFSALNRLADTQTPALLVHLPAIEGTPLARTSAATLSLGAMTEAMALISRTLIRDSKKRSVMA